METIGNGAESLRRSLERLSGISQSVLSTFGGSQTFQSAAPSQSAELPELEIPQNWEDDLSSLGEATPYHAGFARSPSPSSRLRFDFVDEERGWNPRRGDRQMQPRPNNRQQHQQLPLGQAPMPQLQPPRGFHMMQDASNHWGNQYDHHYSAHPSHASGVPLLTQPMQPLGYRQPNHHQQQHFHQPNFELHQRISGEEMFVNSFQGQAQGHNNWDGDHHQGHHHHHNHGNGHGNGHGKGKGRRWNHKGKGGWKHYQQEDGENGYEGNWKGRGKWNENGEKRERKPFNPHYKEMKAIGEALSEFAVEKKEATHVNANNQRGDWTCPGFLAIHGDEARAVLAENVVAAYKIGKTLSLHERITEVNKFFEVV